MKVSRRQKTNHSTFEAMPFGDVFESEGVVFVKCGKQEIMFPEVGGAAVSLVDGHVRFFEPTDVVDWKPSACVVLE